MLRLALLLVLLPGFGLAEGESVRQFHAQTATPAAELARNLDARLPEAVTMVQTEGQFALSYTGNATPETLVRFADAAFERFDPAMLAPGRTVSLTLSGAVYGDTTALSLMILARFAGPQAPVPPGAVVVLDGTGPGACEGQLVLQFPGPRKEARPAMLAHMEQAGFAFPDADPDETSFFIGQAPGCAAAVYLEPNGKTTLIVLRYLEDQ